MVKPILDMLGKGGITVSQIALFYDGSTQHILLQLLAGMVDKASLDKGLVYPPLSQIRHVSTDLAEGLIDFAYRHKLAHLYPEPRDKKEFIKAHQYNTDYQNIMPAMYEWPEGLGNNRVQNLGYRNTEKKLPYEKIKTICLD